MHQPDHAVGNGDRNAGRHQRTLARTEFDLLGAVEIHTGVAVMGAAGQRQPRVQANHRKTFRHGATDYP